MSMEITVTKAFSGDCIWIRCGEKDFINIIVDSGPSQFNRGFRELIKQIKSKHEVVDLLILTHIDDDHIKGFINYLGMGNDCSVIKKIMFNSGIYLSNNLHSPTSAGDLIKALKAKTIEVLSPIYDGFCIKIGEAEIKVITPTKNSVDIVNGIIEKKTGISLHSNPVEYQDLDEIRKYDIYKR